MYTDPLSCKGPFYGVDTATCMQQTHRQKDNNERPRPSENSDGKLNVRTAQTTALNIPPVPPQQAVSEVTQTMTSQVKATSDQTGGNCFSFVGYLLESFVCSNGIKDHLTDDVLGDPEKMLHVGTSLIDTLVNPSDKEAVRVARELPSKKFKFFYDRDLEADEIRRVVPRYWLSLFAITPPEFRLGKYLVRLTNNLRCEIDCFVMALCLIRRVVKTNEFPICSRSVHRLFLAASVVAAKMRDDKYYPTKFYATIGGVKQADIEAMEVSLLNILEFDAGVSSLEYLDMLYSLRVHCAGLAFAQKHTWAQKAWCELISRVRYPDRDRFVREMRALQCPGAYVHKTVFIRDLGQFYRPLAHTDDNRNEPPLVQHLVNLIPQPVLVSCVDESTTTYPNRNPELGVHHNSGGVRFLVHDTPMGSISDKGAIADRTGCSQSITSVANVTSLVADSVSALPVQYQHIPNQNVSAVKGQNQLVKTSNQYGSQSNRTLVCENFGCTAGGPQRSSHAILSTGSSPNKLSGQPEYGNGNAVAMSVTSLTCVNSAAGALVNVQETTVAATTSTTPSAQTASTGAAFGPGESMSTLSQPWLGSGLLKQDFIDISRTPLFDMATSSRTSEPESTSPLKSNASPIKGSCAEPNLQQSATASGTRAIE